MVLEAIKTNGNAFLFASERLKNDKDFVYQIMQYDLKTFKHASDLLKDN
jgi:hypothetical protein